MPLEGDKLRGLASRLGYREGEEELLVRDYHDTTDSIRATYASFFGLDEKKSGRAGDTPGPGRPHETG
jgi:hypothetical protein